MTQFQPGPLPGSANSAWNGSVAGRIKAGFEPVRVTFQSVVQARPGYGAALCIYVGDECVVDLWGGSYVEDSLQLVFSATKGSLAVCAHILVQRGILDLDAPVASVWPAFGAAGKGELPIRWLLSHRAGLSSAEIPLPILDYAAGGRAVDVLAKQAPFWEPGTAHGYHGLTLGTLMGELIGRLTGRTLGEFFASEVAEPLGLEFWIGLPEALEPRVKPIQMDARSQTHVLTSAVQLLQEPGSVASRASTVLRPTDFNLRQLHEVEMPAANGIGTARALARVYAACMGSIDGVRLLDEVTLARACETQTSGRDLMSGEENRFGLGFYLPFARLPFAGPSSFGHDGAGGALAFGDRDSGIAFAFLTDLVPPLLGADPATDQLISATKACLHAG